MRRSRLTAIPVLAALLLLALAPVAEARRTVPHGFVGMNWDGPIVSHGGDGQFGRIASSGGESVRATFSWAHAQPIEQGPFDLSATDRIVAAASGRNLTVLPVVILAPRWARRGRSERYPFTPPTNYNEFNAYLTALVQRYGPQGTFWSENPTLRRLPIRDWQIWNEPHLQYQWTIDRSEDWVPQYAWLVFYANAALEQADPGARLVLAGLSNESWKYVRQLYTEGLGEVFDVAAIHPYTRSAEGVVELVRRFRRVMAEYGDQRKPLWVTELGLPAARGRSPSNSNLQTTDAGMARFLRDSYRLLAKARRRQSLRVGRAYWYTWASRYSGREKFAYSGLFRLARRGGLHVRPAYRLFLRIARELEGCRKTAAGRCR